ncbi:hypothetical protein [Glutamicibacter sp. NPDC087344]|uniref:hypothetical protein n=1 Tax=Glutamicibacter sp. NPDC087344 TaxID=3363994 RepID=UPI00380FA56C
MTQQPTVGRIVHYQSFYQTEPLAAVIAAVDGNVATLTVFQPDGTTKPIRNTPHADTLTEGHWSWPAR